MESILVYNDLWQYVDGTEVKPAENAQDWMKKDAKALALINLSITHSQLSHVKKAETSRGAWDILKGVFESKGPVRKATLYKQLLRMEKGPNITMTQHVNEFSSKAGQLEEAGIEIPEELLSIMLLGSLPTQFENFSVAIESRDDIPSLEVLKAKLKEKEARQNERDTKTADNGTKNEALLTKGNTDRGKQSRPNWKGTNTKTNFRKFDGKCYNCDKIGHRSRDCRSKKKSDKAANSDNVLTAIACNAELARKSESWCLDSGATSHMCNDKQKFEVIDKDEQSRVYTAAEHYVKSIGKGNASLNLKINQRENKIIKLENVLYVPELRNNLLSVSTITKRGYDVIFNENRAFIKRKNGSTILTATKRDELYIVDEETNRAFAAKHETDENLLKWHQRYGHVNIYDLKKMKVEEMVDGMNFVTKSSEFICEVCAKCKIHVQPFKNSVHREREILSLIHSDICGPTSVESLGGAKYFVTFSDDCTGYTETIMLRNRSDVLEAFKGMLESSANSCAILSAALKKLKKMLPTQST